MMRPEALRRITWLFFGLGLAIAAPGVSEIPRVGAGHAEDVRVGAGRAYAILGDLPVNFQDRVKPLFCVAIDEVNRIHGRYTIQLRGSDGKTTSSWEPVAALLDWSARPDFWDDQEFILVEDLPLRRLLLGALPAKFGEDRKWLSPRELETARLQHEGHTLTFPQWVGEILDKKAWARSGGMGAASGLTPLEEKAAEVGERLLHYQGIREHYSPAIKPLDLLVVPRPHGGYYSRYSTEAFERGMRPDRTLSPLEANVANTLVVYLQGLQSKDWALPGEDGAFDQKFALWLLGSAPWIPLGVILASDESELSRAGFPLDQVLAFRKSYRDFEDAERAAPGNVPEAIAVAMIAAARDLGTSLGPYPDPAAMARESHLNRFAPFSKASMALGFGLVPLLLSLGITAHLRTAAGKLGALLYWLGMAGLMVGIALGLYGVWLRFRIFRLVPVTNVYETVIWVALATSVLGLALELLWRKKYSALAASGIALLATVLAENVALLDPNIRAVLPEQRINRWLAGHVLTIVSSYAAFALALGLGLLAVGHYLTATYRRSPSYRELAWPLLAGIPLYVCGRLGIDPSYRLLPLRILDSPLLHYASSGFVATGGVLTIVGGFSLLGELANRSPRRACVLGVILVAVGSTGLIAATTGVVRGPLTRALTSYDAWLASPVGGALIVMSLLGAQSREASARIECLAGLICRAMLVGVLLLAAGTIVGGAWAHEIWRGSWGWDPKVIGALITLLVYLVPLYGRLAGWMTTFRVVAASVVCFIPVLMSWYGVNFVLRVGLHNYGFTEGSGQRTVMACTLALLAVVGAAAWRRSVSLRTEMEMTGSMRSIRSPRLREPRAI